MLRKHDVFFRAKSCNEYLLIKKSMVLWQATFNALINSHKAQKVLVKDAPRIGAGVEILRSKILPLYPLTKAVAPTLDGEGQGIIFPAPLP